MNYKEMSNTFGLPSIYKKYKHRDIRFNIDKVFVNTSNKPLCFVISTYVDNELINTRIDFADSFVRSYRIVTDKYNNTVNLTGGVTIDPSADNAICVDETANVIKLIHTVTGNISEVATTDEIKFYNENISSDNNIIYSYIQNIYSHARFGDGVRLLSMNRSINRIRNNKQEATAAINKAALDFACRNDRFINMFVNLYTNVALNDRTKLNSDGSFEMTDVFACAYVSDSKSHLNEEYHKCDDEIKKLYNDLDKKSVITSIVNYAKQNHDDFYVICPHCGSKINMNEYYDNIMEDNYDDYDEFDEYFGLPSLGEMFCNNKYTCLVCRKKSNITMSSPEFQNIVDQAIIDTTSIENKLIELNNKKQEIYANMHSNTDSLVNKVTIKFSADCFN